ncbi:hypothetical protein WMY93_019787 [Mugilogobius chulae]|uniref:P-type domain-containing protein n=1 Tax=Mugilogobius chulae TaxID=88201 RepID=A0AAW0NJI4_9GOBI
MGPNRVECVAVLTWALLLLSSVQGWTEITDSRDFNDIWEGQYSVGVDTAQPDPLPEPFNPMPNPPAKLPFQFDKEDIDGEEVIDLEDNDDDYDDGGDPFFDNWGDNKDLDVKSKVYDSQFTAVKKPAPGKKDPTGFDFTCSKKAFKIYVFKKEIENVKVIGMKDLLSVQEGEKKCGYDVNREQGILTVPFTACFVKTEKANFSLQLLLDGGSQVRTATCPIPGGLTPRAGAPDPTVLKCPFQTPEPPKDPLNKRCIVHPVEQKSCGSTDMQSCESKDCCWDHLSSFCFFPEDVLLGSCSVLLLSTNDCNDNSTTTDYNYCSDYNDYCSDYYASNNYDL